ncbi:hypothetical protein OE88DRAFT_1631605 [Heliocybe sulcata]|uniref:Transmembrane protein n=1 Tax=Heliocybe sulcata TaxID=5364 RepID=A0A5C3MZT5_9AGAM|nr:hypothetical protein OE88DRAFT_1631605 [Heliocybe sulcata]
MYLFPSNDSLSATSSTITALAAASSSSLPDNVCRDIDNCRTLYSIVRSCVATILACTWVAIHANIPPQDAHWARILGRQVLTTVYAIIAPECVVVWAAKQWFASRKLAEMNKEKHGWTQTHGFFAIMGGFVIFEDDHAVRPRLDLSTLPFPDITKDEIQDKSKGDWLSKGFAILQTSWFLVQCIARRVQHLPLTELELATCAFATLNAVVYGLWWNKPKAATCPYAIGRVVRSSRGTDVAVEQFVHPPTFPPGHHEKWGGTLWRWLRSTPKKIIDGIVNLYRQYNNDWLGMLAVPFFLVIKPVFSLMDMMSGGEIHEQDKHVDPYYSGNSQDGTPVLLLIAIACSSAFGAIHCIGWSFAFPSHTEQILWRGCSLAITCLPLLTVFTVVIAAGLQLQLEAALPAWMGSILDALTVCVIVAEIFIYIAARITLLTIAFLALSSLPAAAYRTVSWTDYIPHI